MRHLALLASLLLPALAPAQALRNCTLTSIVSVIDWQGRPMLCLVTMGEGPICRFEAPFFWIGPKLELAVYGYGVIDQRPCAPGSFFGIQVGDNGIPQNKLVGNTALLNWTVPMLLNDQPGNDPVTPHYWISTYCTSGSCRTSCGTQAQGPQYSAVICLPVLK